MHPMLLSWLHYPKCGSLCCGLKVAGAILLKDHGYKQWRKDVERASGNDHGPVSTMVALPCS
jgi:hypothetical protein